MGAHAKLSPSAAGRWMRCPGSVALSEGIKETPSAYAEEGTLAHSVAAECLETGKSIPGNIEKEMVDNVQEYVDFVAQWTDEPWWIEQPLNLSHLIPESFGTADFITLVGSELIVVDLKYGQGVKVYAEGNRQLLIYGLGALHMLNLIYKIDSVRMVIVQPRLDHIDEASILVADLLDFGTVVSEAATRVLVGSGAELAPGLEQCRWCRAKAICKARAAANLQAAMDDFGPLPAGNTLTLEEIGGLLPKLDDIKAWAKDLQEYALTQALSGEAVAGYKLVRGKSNRKWKLNAAETIETLPEADQLIEKKIIGIGKAEKLLGKKHPVFTELTTKPKGKPTLVIESDRRKAVKPKEIRPTAAEEFNERIEDGSGRI